MTQENNEQYAPQLAPEQWTKRDRQYLEVFATDIDSPISTLRNLPPEIIGAFCSRASRAKGSLLRVLLNEYIYPILDGTDKKLAKELDSVVTFLHTHGFKNILNNQRAQGFYTRWLSQYGDDSIAQVTGTHLALRGVSQVAMKFMEDQRIGLEPIEKSTRYVNFGEKQSNGRYLYYTPGPDLKRLGLIAEYRHAMDGLFATYNMLVPQLTAWLKSHYDEKESVLEKKAFDTLRGLLPMATLGQVAFRGNAQAFEYLISRMRRHALGEFRWIAHTAKHALDQEIPSLLLRIEEEKGQTYQTYLANNAHETEKALEPRTTAFLSKLEQGTKPQVRLVEYDARAEEKILTALLYSLPHTKQSWETIAARVKTMSEREKKKIIAAYFQNRTERWYKPSRALENCSFRFDVVMDIGAYRDLHRHRMLTQERQLFSIHHGYDIPPEVTEAGLAGAYRKALDSVVPLFRKLERADPELAQYAVPLAYRIRFYQLQNAASLFWTTELRTGPQGHPNYRTIEQEKFRLVQPIIPHVAAFMRVDMNDYPFARRGESERMEAREKRITQRLSKKK